MHMKIEVPTIEEVLDLLDSPNEANVGGNEIRLKQKYGIENLIPVYVKAFPKIKNWPGRMYISFTLIPYVKINQDVFDLALIGIFDKSKIVRNYCCSMLAYAKKTEAIPYLKKLNISRYETSHEDAIAAIAAIEKQNHHLWVDREDSGNIFWEPKYA